MAQNAYRPRHASRDPLPKKRMGCLTRILIFLLLLALLSYPFVEPLLLQTENVTLVSEDLPSDVEQLRLVYLSDIHAGYFFSEKRVESLVQKVNALHADIVLLGGDYAVDSTSAIEFFKTAPRFQSRYGVFAVMGNHDRTEPESNLSLLRSAMRSAGVTPLVNETAAVRIGQDDIYIAGIDDVNNGWPQLTALAGKMDQDDYVIFLSHSPELIPSALSVEDRNGHKQWFDLGLFGHTHGGQIPILNSLLEISKVEKRYEQGWLRENRTDMLISRGVGTAVFPARFLCPPQIHLITVKGR